MKRSKLRGLTILLFLSLLLCGCGNGGKESPVPEQVGITDPIHKYIARRCGEMADLCCDLYMEAEKTEAENAWSYPSVSQETVDAMEVLLLETGFDVMDSSSDYPSYLATADRFDAFWDRVQQGKSARQEIVGISQYGILEYRLFDYDADADKTYFYTMTYGFASDTQTSYEGYPVLDWDVTENGNFYYQIRSADHSHYEDYTLVRLIAPDKALYAWNARCILPIGYTATNLFLTDWSETDWKDLSFNDLWEYFYLMEYGSPCLPHPEDLIPESKRYQIPAEAFEGLVKQYFAIDTDTLRVLAQYQPQMDAYPWRPVQPNDFEFLKFASCTPEITGCRDNGDGTVTLTVEVLSTDLKTDCLFAHEVTIRPMESGGFQYVSNRITYQTEYGLPYNRPRLAWD